MARRNGDNVDEIVDGLRDHVERKATLGGVAVVDVDLLIEVLHEVGAPNDVIEMDAAAFATRAPRPAAPRPEPRRVEPPQQGRQVPNHSPVVVKQSSVAKWIFFMMMLFVGVVVAPITVFLGLVAVPNIFASREAAQQVHEEQVQEVLSAECVATLEQIGEALKKYAADHGGRYPIPFDNSGNMRGFALEFMELYPDYTENQNYGFCPSVLEDVGPASSYVYPYMAAQSEAGFKTFGMQYSHILQADGDGQPIPNAYKSVTFNHTSASDAARTPLVIERPHNHGEAGGHVLYLDGHVGYIEYGTKYPMNDGFFETRDVFQMYLNQIQGRIDEARARDAAL